MSINLSLKEMVIMALTEEITQPKSKLHAVKCGLNPNNACFKWRRSSTAVNSSFSIQSCRSRYVPTSLLTLSLQDFCKI